MMLDLLGEREAARAAWGPCNVEVEANLELEPKQTSKAASAASATSGSLLCRYLIYLGSDLC